MIVTGDTPPRRTRLLKRKANIWQSHSLIIMFDSTIIIKILPRPPCLISPDPHTSPQKHLSQILSKYITPPKRWWHLYMNDVVFFNTYHFESNLLLFVFIFDKQSQHQVAVKKKKKKKLFGKHLPVRLSTELALEECCCCYCWLASSGYCFRNVRLESAVKIQQLATSNKLCGKESWHSHYMPLLLASMEMGKLDKLSFSLFLSFVFVYSCFVVWQRKLLPRQLCSRFYFSSVL